MVQASTSRAGTRTDVGLGMQHTVGKCLGQRCELASMRKDHMSLRNKHAHILRTKQALGLHAQAPCPRAVEAHVVPLYPPDSAQVESRAAPRARKRSRRLCIHRTMRIFLQAVGSGDAQCLACYQGSMHQNVRDQWVGSFRGSCTTREPNPSKSAMLALKLCMQPSFSLGEPLPPPPPRRRLACGARAPCVPRPPPLRG